MSNVRFELNSAGVVELMKSSEIVGECQKIASSAMASLGDGYVMSAWNGRSRSGYAISAESYAARKDCEENDTLARTVGA